jgi:hypothetical protein
MPVTDRIEQELTLLREVYPDLQDAVHEQQQWALIPQYPMPPGWHAIRPNGPRVERVELAFKVPPQREAVPYGFAVRPMLALPDGGTIANYSDNFLTAWGGEFGHFSWQSEEGWHPKDDIRKGDNMLDFVRSFAERLRSLS